jgi:nucleoside-diphosphate-sugar epimerase
MTKTLLSIGHGYSARALDKILLAEGWTVIGTSRTSEGCAALAARGVEAVHWPHEDLTPYFKRATHMLTSVAPSDDGDAVLSEYANVLASSEFEWVGYLSTTGVYGDHKGGWVNEETPLKPSTKRGMARVTAEAAWQSLSLPLHIFRLAGIYGPGRGPFSKVRNGTARRIIKKNQLFSRIHVEDIAQIVAASIANPRSGAVYNVCDNHAAPPEDVIAYAAELLGVSIPEAVKIEDAEMTAMARSFYAESKRVDNRLIIEELGVKLMYPDYKSGLRALVDEEK